MSQLTTQCTESCSIILDNLVLGEKHGIKITQKIILRFIWVVLLPETDWYIWRKNENRSLGLTKSGLRGENYSD